MKYKIKFEIDNSELSKAEIRDIKIDLLISDTDSEFDFNPLFKIPEKGERIMIGDIEWEVMGYKYSLNKNEYKVIVLIIDERIKRINTDKQLKDMINNIQFNM